MTFTSSESVSPLQSWAGTSSCVTIALWIGIIYDTATKHSIIRTRPDTALLVDYRKKEIEIQQVNKLKTRSNKLQTF